MRTNRASAKLRARTVILVALLVMTASYTTAQHVTAIRPDRAAPGMTVIVEVLAKANDIGGLGNEGLEPALTRCYPLHPADSERVLVGPIQTSWRYRLMQIPLFISANAALGPLPLVLQTATGIDIFDFTIAKPEHLPTLSGNIVIGVPPNPPNGSLSQRNTLLVDSLIATNATITISLRDPDTTVPGNPRFEPVTILSTGPIHLWKSTISVDASGLNGGPGGGGGGHGFPGVGGVGFTGGGNAEDASSENAGSDSASTLPAGGRSITGVAGGGSVPDDQGGGGGTGAPFGTSGAGGMRAGDSRPGGWGGGSAGGETSGLNPIEYGGGGGGFGTSGAAGLGTGLNGGNTHGGRWLIPLAGGSGGGAGNANDLANGQQGGSGGGGGGAISLIAFDSIVADSSRFVARGDSGTSGQKYGAGGGGGSGGAVYLASATGISGAGLMLATNGGTAGKGSIKNGNIEYDGGAGGDGRIRLDGPTTSASWKISGQAAEGISIAPIRGVQSGSFVHVGGTDADTINTLDTIRIYYRSPHTAWQFVDTVRSRLTGAWTKWIPSLHDSLLEVVALAKINAPSSDFANFEPDWVMSHVGMSVIRHAPSPAIVMDTSIDFGTVRLGHCATRWLRISNEGEAPLIISSLPIVGSTSFTILKGKDTISAYSSDSIEVQFCPDTVGLLSAQFALLSNDSANLSKDIHLRGVGSKRKDSLVIRPSVLHFGHVLIGHCTSDTVRLYSVGTDTLYLSWSKWNQAPFSAQLLGHDSILAPRDSARLIVSFCPTDTLNAAAVAILDERQDSLRMDGLGTERHLVVTGTSHLGTVCAGTSIPFADSLKNEGNDTLTLASLKAIANSGAQASISLPYVFQPHELVVVTWHIPVIKFGISPDTLHDTLEYFTSDSLYRSIVSYRVVQPLLTADAIVAFHFLCVDDEGTMLFRMRNATSDTITISNIRLLRKTPFTLLDSISSLAPGDSAALRIRFHPQAARLETDSLSVMASVSGCDSTYIIPVSGTGTVSRLAADSIHFDTLFAGECRDSSLIIQNTCGPNVWIDTVLVHNPNFTYIPPFPDTLRSKSSVVLHFRYCPTMAGSEVDTITIVPRGDSAFHATLRGFARVRLKPTAYFHLTNATILSGTERTTGLWLDSSSLSGTHHIAGGVTFDPEVVYPRPSGPLAVMPSRADSISFSGVLNFSNAPQFVTNLNWLGLLGPRSSTILSLNITADTLLDAHVANGVVAVIDCSGLSGHVSVASAYRLGQVVMGADGQSATVHADLGNDGYVDASLYDVTGRLSRKMYADYLDRGSHELQLPLSQISSGRYFLVVSSLGWRQVRPLLIDR